MKKKIMLHSPVKQKGSRTSLYQLYSICPHKYVCRKNERYQNINSGYRYLFFFFLLFSAAPLAYESSQARGPIRAVAAGLHHNHSNSRSELPLWPTPPTPQVTASQILNLLSKARDQTCNLKVPRRIRFHWAMTGMPLLDFSFSSSALHCLNFFLQYACILH